MSNYVITHCHTDYSNLTSSMMDSITKVNHYIEKAKQEGMKALCFTEHGNFHYWKNKKEAVEAAGMKYIHGVEAYVTKSLDEKVRDNYHVVLMAKNYDGVKELNYLMSHRGANNRESGNYYYVPRISYADLKSTSDNVLITTACLGGIFKSKDAELKKDFVKFLTANKHRCFLEVQHHCVEDQKLHNQMMYKISQGTGVRLIAGTDTHSLNEDYAKGRTILQRSKRIVFSDEDGWDLTFKTYNELVSAFEGQGVLPKDVYMEAIKNTNIIADMVEEFELDKSYKYPKIYEDAEGVFKQKIANGIKERGVKLDKEKIDRINRELKVYKDNGSIDFMLLEEDYKSWCRNNDIAYGYSRGSVSGSYIAYLLKITEMDSIKHKLNFERFMNSERVSLADIDSDIDPSKRDLVKQYLYNKKGLYCADIITFNTIALKGAIRDAGRALDIPLDVVSDISQNIEEKEVEYRESFPELFKYVDLLNGVIVSSGTHPAGLVVSPFPLEDTVGTCTLSTSNYPITQVNMKELDGNSFLKLDLLALDTVKIISEACKMAEIEYLTPDNMDVEDEKVWKSIAKSSVGIFQWESNSGQGYIRKLFSDGTIEKIKEINEDFSYIDLFSMGNGAIRPAGESYRESLARGEFNSHRCEALDEFLKPTLGHLVFQEQIIEFLNRFCGFTMGQSDIIRRGFAKKTGTEEYIPKIKEGFVKTMKSEYDMGEEVSEKIVVDFLEVIEAASSYAFSLNHSQAYSYLGYACAWLRYHHPLEFLTAALNTSKDNHEKVSRIYEYVNSHTDIQLKPVKFRYSKAEYMFDRKSNSIYKGIASIKYLNETVADNLYELRNNQYDSFIDLLVDIKRCTGLNSRQLNILIMVDFFSEFGRNKKLMEIVNIFNEMYEKKQFKKEKVDKLGFAHDPFRASARETEKSYMDIDWINIVKELCRDIEDKRLSISEQITMETEQLGEIQFTLPEAPEDVFVSLETKLTKYSPMVRVYNISSGNQESLWVGDKSLWVDSPIKKLDVFRITDRTQKSLKNWYKIEI